MLNVNKLWIDRKMVFQPGQSGNPGGSRGRKPIIDAVNTLVSLPWSEGTEPDLGGVQEKLTVAHALALKLVKGGLRDDWEPGESLAYFKEICDRVYGKARDDSPPSSVTHITINISKTSNFLADLTGEGADGAIRGDVPERSLLPASIRTE